MINWLKYIRRLQILRISHLTLTVPPETPQITTMDGKVLKELVGPYNEGDSLQLMCTTNGGKPKPSLSCKSRIVLCLLVLPIEIGS